MNKSHTLPNWYCMSLKELKKIQNYNSINSYYRKGPIRTPKGNEILFELAGVWDSWVGVEFLHIFEQDIEVILVHFEEIICLSTDYDLVCTIFGHCWLQSVISTVRNVALREEIKIHVADSKLLEKTLQGKWSIVPSFPRNLSWSYLLYGTGVAGFFLISCLQIKQNVQSQFNKKTSLLKTTLWCNLRLTGDWKGW